MRKNLQIPIYVIQQRVLKDILELGDGFGIDQSQKVLESLALILISLLDHCQYAPNFILGMGDIVYIEKFPF